MPELRHLKVHPLIDVEDGAMMDFVHEKLHTVVFVRVTPSLLRSGFFDSIPNIRRLGMFFEGELSSSVFDFSHLHRLRTLRCSNSYLLSTVFPSNIRKLFLSHCDMSPAVSMSLCALPSLEVLRIDDCSFQGKVEVYEEEWKVGEGDDESHETNFPRLLPPEHRVLL